MLITRLRWMALTLVAALPMNARAAVFTIAVDQHFPPFVKMEQGKPAGLGIALLHAAAERAGLTLSFVAKPFAQLQAAVETGETEAIFPLAANPQRLERFDFSEPLISTGGALFVRHPDATPASVHALHGKPILTPRTGPLVSVIQRMAPDIPLIMTQDYDETLTRLVAGQASAAALNLQVGRQLVAAQYAGQITLPDRYFWEVSLAVAVLKASPTQHEKLLRLNTGIREIRADGTWQALTDAHHVFMP